MSVKLDDLFCLYKLDPITHESEFWSAIQSHIRRRSNKLYGIERDELTQDIVVKVLQELPKFDGRLFSRWLDKLISCRIIDRIRRRKTELTYENQYPLDDDGVQLEPALDGYHECFVEVPDEIQGKDRDIAELVLQGYRFSEIAHIQGCSTGAVKMRFNRLVKKLQSDVTFQPA